jgi:predicted ArsR family transcriptional regulator
MSMTTSRQRVLAYLRKHQPVSAAEASRALGVTQANIRRHLSILIEQGLVVASGSRSKPGRGRPARLYRLSLAVLGDNLANLVSSLLSETVGPLEEESREVLLERLARRLPGGLETPDHTAVTVRLAGVVQRLNEYHYQARWEAHAGGPRLIFDHCPYARIIDNHPELCQLDAVLLRQWLGRPVRQAAKLEANARGGRYCLFDLAGD